MPSKGPDPANRVTYFDRPGVTFQEQAMKEKDQIVNNWLPRYTGVPLEDFGEHILLTNFGGYLGHFSKLTGAPVIGIDRPMPSCPCRS